MKSFTNEPTNISFNKIVLNSVVTLTADSSGDTWTLVLPTESGSSGQVLTTDGSGITSWTAGTGGTVTSVGIIPPTFLSATAPITSSGDITLAYNGVALPVTSGGTGVVTKTGTGSVVLNDSPIISTYLDMAQNEIRLYSGVDTNHGLLYDGVVVNGPNLHGFDGGRLSSGNGGGTARLTWTSAGIEVPGLVDAGSMTLSTALPITSGGTGTTIATGTDNLVLSNSPFIISPTLTTSIIKGVFSNTILDTQSTALWTMSLPIDGGTVGQVLSTNGSGLTSWESSTTGTLTSVGLTVPAHLSIANSPVTGGGGTMAITYSGSALSTTYGGTGVTGSSTGSGGVVLSTSPEITTPDIVGTSFSTTLDTEATADYIFKLPVDGGTSNQIFRSDGDGTNSWMGLAPSMGILGGALSVSAATLSSITTNASDIFDLDEKVDLNEDNQDAVNALQVTANAGFSATSTLMSYIPPAVPIFVQPALTAQVITNAVFTDGIGSNATAITNLSGSTTASLNFKLSTVGINVPGFLSASAAVTTTDGTGGDIDITLNSGTALPVTSGGTGVVDSTGTGKNVLSTDCELFTPVFFEPKVQGVGIGNTILKSLASSDWTLSLPVDAGDNLELLRTNGSGATTWAPVTGTGSVVLNDSPTISSLTLTSTTNVNSLLVMNDNEIRLRGSGDAAHGLGYDGVVIDGPNLHGTSGGRLSQGSMDGTTRLTWNSGGVDVPDILSAGSLTLTTDLAIAHGGTGTSTATGSGDLVLKSAPSIDSPLLTDPKIAGSFNTTIDTQATADWTLSLPVDGGIADQVLTTGGSGVTSWSAVSTGTVTSVQTSVPSFLEVLSPAVETSGTIAITYSGTALPYQNGGTGETTLPTGTGTIVKENTPTITDTVLTGATTITLADTVEFGAGTVDKEISAGKIGYGTFDSGHSLNIVGAGESGFPRFVRIFDNLELTNPLSTTYGGTGSTSATGSGSVVLGTGPTISTLTTTGTTNMDTLVLTNALPITSGGTGTTTATGTGDLVLSTNPYIRGDSVEKFVAQFQDDTGINTSLAITTGEFDEAALFFGTNNGDSKTGAHKNAIISDGINSWSRADLHFCLNNAPDNSTSASLADSRMMIEPDGNVGIGTVSPASALDVNGTITANNLILDNALPVAQGGTGATSSTGTGNLVLATSPSISGTSLTGVTGFTGNMFMNDNHVFLRGDTSHGVKWESDVDGPNLFGTAGGRLSSGGSGRMWWDSNGISTNDSDYFKYSHYSFTPSWGGDGTPSYTGDRDGHIVRIGRNVTVTIEIAVDVTGATNNRDVFFTGMGLANPLSFWQRCGTLADTNVILPLLNFGPHWFVIKNGSSDMNLFDSSGNPTGTTGAGLFTGTIRSTFSYIGPDT